MLPATLYGRQVGPDEIRYRIQSGAPAYGTSANRPERVVFERTAQLSPEVYSLPLLKQVPAIGYLPAWKIAAMLQPADAGAFAHLQAQAALATWARSAKPSPCDPPDFGALPSDFTGTNDDRTVRALKSFQRWSLLNGYEGQRTDGQLDAYTLGSLITAAHGILATPPGQPPPPSTKTAMLWWGVAGALTFAVIFKDEIERLFK